MKYKVVHKGNFFGGMLGIALGLRTIYLNYQDRGACNYFKRGGAGSALCGNDNYIFAALIILVSLFAIIGGVKKNSDTGSNEK